METMTTEEVRQHIGYKRVQDARTWCLRKGIEPLDYRDRNGSLLWPAQHVRDKWAARPGKGARTDLQPPAPDRKDKH